MRGLRAAIVLSRVLHVGAFLPPSGSSLVRGNGIVPRTLRWMSNPAARKRLTLASSPNEAASTPQASPPSAKPVLSFPGGGIFFWWQAGVISGLQERYDLSSLDFVGASAGSLAATLAACDADMDLAMKLALDLCDTNEIWTRPLGLAGVWGAMVEDWLDELLPDEADKICRDRVNLLVIGVWPRPFRRQSVSDFTSKSDLIKACMASVHIPWFMDKHFSARYRGRRFVDGSFRASPEDLSLGEDRPTVYFDYDEDEVMAERRGKFLSLTNKEGLLFMRQRGYDHVQTMIAEGKLDCIRHVELPVQ
ncbi:unnamed protein product, partial [Scytosiphon promiscuus]